jgi:hypothetical protein
MVTSLNLELESISTGRDWNVPTHSGGCESQCSNRAESFTWIREGNWGLDTICSEINRKCAEDRF